MALDKGSPVEHHPINGFSHLKKENGKWVKRIKLSFPELSLLSRQSSALPFPSVKLNAPLSRSVGSALHSVLGGHENSNAAMLNMELGDHAQVSDVFLNGA